MAKPGQSATNPMPDCAHCGRPLFAPTPEGESPLCPQCRQQILAQAGPVAAPRPSVGYKRFPVTNTLLAANVAVYLAMALTGSMSPTLEQLLRWGADYGPATLGPEPWRLVTSMFLHGNIVHIATNMWCLWNLGRMAENIFGRLTFLLAYLFTGVSGGLLSVFLHPRSVSVGASGAIFGVAGALITALYFGKLPIPKRQLNAALSSLIIFALINLSIGAAVPVIDNAGHIGGLVLGLVMGALLAPHLTSDPETRARNQQLVFTALAVLLAVAFWYAKSVRRF